ncbi:MAG: hypothetical protein ACK54P_05015, partial [Bacteroidota bacterium]
MTLTPIQPAPFRPALRMACLLALFFALVFPVQASGGEGDGEKFSPGDMIMHHISDAHQIHIIGDLYIPLPVILLH